MQQLRWRYSCVDCRWSELKPGNVIVKFNRAVVVVVSITPKNLPFKLYNLDVAEYDSFFVRKSGLLVHNEDTKDAGKTRGRGNDGGANADRKSKDRADSGSKKARDSGKNERHGSQKKAEGTRAKAQAVRDKINRLKSLPIKERQLNANTKKLDNTAKQLDKQADREEKWMEDDVRAEGRGPC